MGKPVTVDSDDLEKVLMSTGMIKNIEQIIKQSKSDPFAEKDATILRDAHNSVSKAWRNATRGQCHPSENDPLSPEAAELLRHLSGRICHIDSRVMQETWRDDSGRQHKSAYPELFIKLMIEYGVAREVAYWGGSGDAQRLSPDKTLVRVTLRGMEMLHAIDTAKKSVTQ